MTPFIYLFVVFCCTSQDILNKRNPRLVPYNLLDERTKKTNRDSVNNAVRTLIGYGYNIEPPDQESSKSVYLMLKCDECRESCSLNILYPHSQHLQFLHPPLSYISFILLPAAGHGLENTRGDKVRIFRAEKSYAITQGKWYFEFEAVTTGEMRVGWARPNVRSDTELGADELAYVFNGNKVSQFRFTLVRKV